ncbi:unnamed protein product [Polarella glacialis]|uniref:Uncharacterized protein n=1 Tax=Polarella glacialis TaxID=89957 RepID=A0A813JYT8_POLGL|nr:unnamed protein product [Polarella glacialis]
MRCNGKVVANAVIAASARGRSSTPIPATPAAYSVGSAACKRPPVLQEHIFAHVPMNAADPIVAQYTNRTVPFAMMRYMLLRPARNLDGTTWVPRALKCRLIQMKLYSDHFYKVPRALSSDSLSYATDLTDKSARKSCIWLSKARGHGQEFLGTSEKRNHLRLRNWTGDESTLWQWALSCLRLSEVGDLYVDDGQSHDFKHAPYTFWKGAFIYDEMEFDGKVLESKFKSQLPEHILPGQALHVVGAAKGLPAARADPRACCHTKVPKRYLRVERVTFVGMIYLRSALPKMAFPIHGYMHSCTNTLHTLLEQEVRAARLVCCPEVFGSCAEFKVCVAHAQGLLVSLLAMLWLFGHRVFAAGAGAVDDWQRALPLIQGFVGLIMARLDLVVSAVAKSDVAGAIAYFYSWPTTLQCSRQLAEIELSSRYLRPAGQPVKAWAPEVNLGWKRPGPLAKVPPHPMDAVLCPGDPGCTHMCGCHHYGQHSIKHREASTCRWLAIESGQFHAGDHMARASKTHSSQNVAADYSLEGILFPDGLDIEPRLTINQALQVLSWSSQEEESPKTRSQGSSPDTLWSAMRHATGLSDQELGHFAEELRSLPAASQRSVWERSVHCERNTCAAEATSRLIAALAENERLPARGFEPFPGDPLYDHWNAMDKQEFHSWVNGKGSESEDVQSLLPEGQPLAIGRIQAAEFTWRAKDRILEIIGTYVKHYGALGRCIEWDSPFYIIKAFSWLCARNDVLKYANPRVDLEVRMDVFPKGTRILSLDVLDPPEWMPSDYGLVLCYFVLEHVPDPHKAMKGIAKLLAPGGFLLLGAPFVDGVHGCPDDFFRYTPHGLRKVVEGGGLEVVLAFSPGMAAIAAGDLLGLKSSYFDSKDLFRESDSHPSNVFILARKALRPGMRPPSSRINSTA